MFQLFFLRVKSTTFSMFKSHLYFLLCSYLLLIFICPFGLSMNFWECFIGQGSNPFTVISCKVFSACWLRSWFCHVNFYFTQSNLSIFKVASGGLQVILRMPSQSTAIIHLYFLLQLLWFNFLNLNVCSFGVYPGVRHKLWIQPNSPRCCPVMPVSSTEHVSLPSECGTAVCHASPPPRT